MARQQLLLILPPLRVLLYKRPKVLYTEFSVLTRFHRNDAEVERFAGQQAPGLKNFIALPKELLRKFFTVPITKDCSNQAPLQPVPAAGRAHTRAALANKSWAVLVGVD